MRYCFFTLFCLLGISTVHAEGLPANPWINRNANVSGNTGYVQKGDVPAQTINYSTQYDYAQEMKELQNVAENLKQKWTQAEQTGNSSSNTAKDNNSVSAADAFNAFTTLSKYVEQKENGQNNGQNSGNSTEFGNIKQKFSDMIAQNKAKVATHNSYANQKINKAKYEYNHYKAQLQSNYNSLKSKTKPLYDTMKKSVQEAEKATGVKF